MRLRKKTVYFVLASIIMLAAFNWPVNAETVILLDKGIYEPNTPIKTSISGITAQMISDAGWMAIFKTGADNTDTFYGWENFAAGKSQYILTAPKDAGSYEVRLFRDGSSFNFWAAASFTVGGSAGAAREPWKKASDWALENLGKAYNNGLIPNILINADLTSPITRAEFAAVSIQLYERLSGMTAPVAPASTFTDTQNTDILKAYAISVVSVTGGGKFDPDALLNREQAAVMLTNVYKAVYWEGWNRDNNAAYTAHSLDSKGVAPFADDAKISDWAKSSVYFMYKNGIVGGMGGNIFAPKNTTAAEAVSGYANATREQALIMSQKTFENAKHYSDSKQQNRDEQHTPAASNHFADFTLPAGLCGWYAGRADDFAFRVGYAEGALPGKR